MKTSSFRIWCGTLRLVFIFHTILSLTFVQTTNKIVWQALLQVRKQRLVPHYLLFALKNIAYYI